MQFDPLTAPTVKNLKFQKSKMAAVQTRYLTSTPIEVGILYIEYDHRGLHVRKTISTNLQ